MRDDFTARLTRERRSTEEALRGLERSSKLDQEQRAARMRELTVQLQQFDHWQAQVDIIARKALDAQDEINSAMSALEPVGGQRTGDGSGVPAKNANVGEWADE
jgi:hypothetical protein